MAWYYYSGTVVRPIPRGDGVTVAARPHTKVEILKVTPESQAMIRKGTLRRAGPPADVKERRAPRKAEEGEIPKSTMAKYFAEKGVTSAKGMAPKKPVGKPEMTEPEEAGIRPESATKKDAGVADVSSDADEAGSASDKKSKGRKKK